MRVDQLIEALQEIPDQFAQVLIDGNDLEDIEHDRVYSCVVLIAKGKRVTYVQ